MSSQTSGSTGFYEFLAWLEENKKQVATGAIVAVVLGFAISAYRWKAHQSELAASEALLKLRVPLASAEKATPPDAKAYLKVADDFPGTAAADRASFLAAGAFFTQRDYSSAQAQFGKFLEQRPNHPLAAAAAYGKVACLEAQGKLDEALAGYQTLLAQYPNASLLDTAKLAIGRLYELKNQPEMALKTYEDITRANTPGADSSEASRRRETLLVKFPELAKTNAPAALATNATPAAAVATVPSAASARSTPATTNSPAPKR